MGLDNWYIHGPGTGLAYTTSGIWFVNIPARCKQKIQCSTWPVGNTNSDVITDAYIEGDGYSWGKIGGGYAEADFNPVILNCGFMSTAEGEFKFKIWTDGGWFCFENTKVVTVEIVKLPVHLYPDYRYLLGVTVEVGEPIRVRAMLIPSTLLGSLVSLFVADKYAISRTGKEGVTPTIPFSLDELLKDRDIVLTAKRAFKPDVDLGTFKTKMRGELDEEIIIDEPDSYTIVGSFAGDATLDKSPRDIGRFTEFQVVLKQVLVWKQPTGMYVWSTDFEESRPQTTIPRQGKFKIKVEIKTIADFEVDGYKIKRTSKTVADAEVEVYVVPLLSLSGITKEVLRDMLDGAIGTRIKSGEVIKTNSKGVATVEIDIENDVIISTSMVTPNIATFYCRYRGDRYYGCRGAVAVYVGQNYAIDLDVKPSVLVVPAPGEVEKVVKLNGDMVQIVPLVAAVNKEVKLQYGYAPWRTPFPDAFSMSDLETVRTNHRGKLETNFIPDKAGLYGFYADFVGDAEFPPISAAPPILTVSRRATLIKTDFRAEKLTVPIGVTYSFTGRLVDITGITVEKPLKNATINLLYKGTILASGVTTDTGYFDIMFVFDCVYLKESGLIKSMLIDLEFPGDDIYKDCKIPVPIILKQSNTATTLEADRRGFKTAESCVLSGTLVVKEGEVETPLKAGQIVTIKNNSIDKNSPEASLTAATDDEGFFSVVFAPSRPPAKYKFIAEFEGIKGCYKGSTSLILTVYTYEHLPTCKWHVFDCTEFDTEKDAQDWIKKKTIEDDDTYRPSKECPAPFEKPFSKDGWFICTLKREWAKLRTKMGW